MVANRGGAFLIRFSARRDVADCSAAIAAYRQALELVITGQPERSGYLAQLGQSLRARHHETGRTDDLYEAVIALREAIRLAGPAHRDSSRLCSLLGAALLARYLWHGSVQDLHEAIEWHDRAVADRPGERAGRARSLASRAFALRIRAQRSHDPGEIAAAIDACRQTVDAETDTARLPDRLATLGAALDLRRESAAEVTETIAVRRRACELAAPDEHYRGPWLADLGNSLRTRAALCGGDGGDDDLREAHSLHLAAVESTPPGHREYAMVLSNLAGSFRDHYVRFNRHADLLAAINLLRRTAGLATAPMTRRLVAAQTWGRGDGLPRTLASGPRPARATPPRSRCFRRPPGAAPTARARNSHCGTSGGLPRKPPPAR
ncbi:MAG TPA: hypothetical protein VFO16_22885 [Pseudonocardiaceae bacterium]|nr:hypothetical protein [Pseudonocardiaceae bacterium]